MRKNTFQAIWEYYISELFVESNHNPSPPSSLSLVDDYTSICEVAWPFCYWAEQLVTAALGEPSHEVINYALLQLQEKYFRLFNRAPKDCRQRTFTRPGHVCLVHVYHEAAQILMDARPPLVFISPAESPRPSLPQVGGIFIDVGDDHDTGDQG